MRGALRGRYKPGATLLRSRSWFFADLAASGALSQNPLQILQGVQQESFAEITAKKHKR
jgi:hypothetical protein